jgi:hypothetical protein
MTTPADDPNRARYEQALVGVVHSIHQLGVAFEALALAAKASDPDGTASDDDPAQHAALTSCRALMAAILVRFPGAVQMLGIDALVVAAAKSLPAGGAPIQTEGN